jgi:hypothetical protein
MLKKLLLLLLLLNTLAVTIVSCGDSGGSDSGSQHFFLPKSPLRMLLKGEKTGIRVYGCGRVRPGEGKPTKLCLAGSFFSVLASRTSLHEPFVPFIPVFS